MNPDNNRKIIAPPDGLALGAFISIAGLVPWVLMQFQTALNTNHAWLTIAALRLIGGGDMVTDAYETNPPLSILLYFPAALLTNMGVPIYYAPYLVGLLGLAASASLTLYLLRYWPDLSRASVFVFVVAYVYASALIPDRLYFAERDVFVLWGLLPFAIAQLLITRGISFPRWVSLVALPLCALFILIKPHYVAIPFLIFMHRIWAQRGLIKALKSQDVLAGCMAAAFYAMIIFFFFWDYVTVIFPDFLKFYISIKNPSIIAFMLPAANVITILCMVTPFLVIHNGIKKAIYALSGAALIGLVLYYFQGKGFVYHLVLAEILVACACALFLYSLILTISGTKSHSHVLTIFLIISLGYLVFPINKRYLTHAEYAELTLPSLVRECGENCSFFMFSQNMEMVWQVSIYGGAVHASRFPGLWWLHSMVYRGYDPVDVDKYAGLIAEDLNRYQPAMLLIASNLTVDEGKFFDFIAFHSGNAAFRAALSHYRKVGLIKDDRGDYFRGSALEYSFPIHYDLYVRSSVSSIK